MNKPYQKGRILVIIEPHPETVRLLRSAKRKAVTENLDWEVVVIETPYMNRRIPKHEQEYILNAMTLARSMGAIVTTYRASSMVEGVEQIVEQRLEQGIFIYSVKVGDIKKRRKWFLLHTPFAQKLRHQLDNNIRVATVPMGVDTRSSAMRVLLHVKVEEILISLLAVAFATIIIEMVQYFYPPIIGHDHRNTSILYILTCAFAANRYGLVAGIVAAVASFMVLSLFYVGTYMQLAIDNPADAVSLALFLLVGITLSVMGSSEYGNRFSLAKRADRFHSLLEVHRLALSQHTPQETLAILNTELNSLLDAETMFFMPSLMDEDILENVFMENNELAENEQKALYLCWEESRTTGFGTNIHGNDCEWRFEPLVTSQQEIGVLAVKLEHGFEMDTESARLLAGVSDQVALILERLQLGQLAEENKINAEREKLRSMLLSSVSHDLKTPLASVIGSLSVYRSMGATLPEEHRLTLINTALDEAQRLDSFITNILDMTRIESGQIELKQEWIKPSLLIDDVRKRLRQRLRNHKVKVYPYAQEIEVSMDVLMTGQVLQNILDNAAKYTKEGTQIDILWDVNEEGFSLSVRDHGKGIPADKLAGVFDKYARIKQEDSQVAGTGLGLAIAQAVMHAQEGNITAKNHPEGGAVFSLTLPNTRQINNERAA